MDNEPAAILMNNAGAPAFVRTDALLSIIRALGALPEMTDADMDSVESILAAMRERAEDEVRSAAAIGSPLDCRSATSLLRFYLYKWTKGGEEAASRLTQIVDVRGLEPPGEDRDLLHWIWQAVVSLQALDEEEPALEASDEEAETTSRAFRRLARALERRGEPEVALAMAFSALNLARRSAAVADCAELALRLLGDAGDPAVAARIVTRKALALIAQAVDGPSTLRAFDAVESLIRFLDLAPGEREQTVELVRSALRGVTALRPVGSLLAASDPECELPPELAALRPLTKRTWQPERDLKGFSTDDLVKAAVMVEDERWKIEPPPAGHAEARWNTWSFDYPPFGRAVPHADSLVRDDDVDEMTLTLAHETIHVLSMLGDLGRAATALRLALMEVESRLWSFSGPLDQDHFFASVAPLEEGDLGALAQAEQALELSRKVQALEDAWGPWLEGIAVFGESSAAAEDDEFVTPVTQVLANLVSDEPLPAEASRRGMEISAVHRQRQDEADRRYQEAGRRLATPRLRTFLVRYPRKYLGGYLAVRSVVSTWRRALGDEFTPQMAFRALLHVTRYGSMDAVPDLALPADKFRDQAIEAMAEWVRSLQRIDPEALRLLEDEAHRAEPRRWRDGQLVSVPEEDGNADTAVRPLIDRAMRTLTGNDASLSRVSGADAETLRVMEIFAQVLVEQRWSLGDHDTDLIARFLGRPTILPIANVRCPFWLIQPGDRVAYLLRTNDPPGGPPHHQLVVSSLTPDEAAALETERRRLRDARMTVARVADIAPQTFQPEVRGGGVNFLVFTYGTWIHVEGRGTHTNVDRVAGSLQSQAQQRLLPDPLLDLESTRTADGLAGAQRTRAWLDATDGWTLDGYRYYVEPLAARVKHLAQDVLDRDSHTDADLAAERLLALATSDSIARRLQQKGLDVLRETDPQYVGGVVSALADSATGPAPSPFLDEHSEDLQEVLGELFERTDEGWDVRSNLEAA